MSTPGALRFMEREMRVYRHVWRGSVFSTFVQPVLLLLGMGVFLGTLVDQRGAVEGLSYLNWLAPGLLAAATMQTGAMDGAWPVMAGIKWTKSFDAALASPLQVRDVAWGHFGWVTVRLVLVSLVYAIVMRAFGAATLTGGLLAAGPAVLTGLAFAGLVTAFTSQLEKETGLSSLFRFGIVPLFLFSGTFFPISQLPGMIQPLAVLTPLWHGVELTRWAALGLDTRYPPWLHAAVLAALFVAGALLTVRFLARRLVE